jgi:hypothetical protein
MSARFLGGNGQHRRFFGLPYIDRSHQRKKQKFHVARKTRKHRSKKRFKKKSGGLASIGVGISAFDARSIVIAGVVGRQAIVNVVIGSWGHKVRDSDDSVRTR